MQNGTTCIRNRLYRGVHSGNSTAKYIVSCRVMSEKDTGILYVIVIGEADFYISSEAGITDSVGLVSSFTGVSGITGFDSLVEACGIACFRF